MNYAEALRFLESLDSKGGRWISHCKKTAEVAHKIAAALRDKKIDVEPEKVRLMALFHDVGRSIGHGILHGWDGFQIMQKHGLEGLSRCTVSHWLKGRTIEETLKEGSELERDFLENVFRESGCGVFTLEDKIVSLADSLTNYVTITTVKNRYDDARYRYGESDWLDTNEKISQNIKDEFSAILGFDLYRLFNDIKTED